jgi:hypothetical protein
MISFLPTLLAVAVLAAIISRNHEVIDKIAGAYVFLQGLMCLVISGYILLMHLINQAADGARKFEVLYVIASFALAIALLISGLGLFSRRSKSRILSIAALLVLGSVTAIKQRWNIYVPFFVWIIILINTAAPFVVVIALSKVAWSERRAARNAT